MAYCSVLREWSIESTNVDGEPRKMLVPLEGCVTCGKYQECLSMVRTAFVLENLMDAVREADKNGSKKFNPD